MPTAPAKTAPLAVLSLITGAIVWGLIWYPYRVAEDAGISPSLATATTYGIAFVLALGLFRRRLAGAWPPSGLLLAIGAASVGANLGYVLAIVHGEVMRVMLLFYTAPLWTVLFARLLLGERVNGTGWGVMALSLAGAFVMLWRPEAGLPLPASVAEWTGLAAGVCFALTNVLSRRAHALSVEVKSLYIWGAVALAALVPGLLEPGAGAGPAPWLLLGLVGVVILAVNLVVQHGLAHTPAARAIVIFLFELVVAALGAWFLAGEAMAPREFAGGALIVAASLLSGRLEPEGEGGH